jgi:hypothetical protein
VATPRFATPRTHSRRTRGPEVAKVARMLGYAELHPWQRAGLDVAYEVDELGRLVYQRVIWLVPRRAGKTVTGLSAIVHRGHAFGELGRQLSMSTMQSAIDSRAMFKDVWLPQLERSSFAGTFTPVHQISHEQVRWEGGSVHSVRAPKVGSGVGGDVDLWLDDEAWHWTSSDFEGAVLPTMGTRTDPQVWHTSMAGDTDSARLIELRDLGRDLVAAGVNTGTCYLEFSAADDDDPMDEQTWWRVHPALGRTLTVERLRTFAQSMPPATFAKEFLNVWPTRRAAGVIDPELWDACADPSSAIAGDRVWLGVDALPNAEQSSIVACGLRDDGVPHLELVRSDRGITWLEEAVPAIADANPKARWCMDARSGARAVLPKLHRAGVKVVETNVVDACSGALALFNAIRERSVRWLGPVAQPPLDAAVRNAQRRHVGEAWTWKRTPGIDSTPLVAASLAFWTAQQPDDEERDEYQWRPWQLGRSDR